MLRTTRPDFAAVHVHQTLWPPVVWAMTGSAASAVALTFVPEREPCSPESDGWVVKAARLAKLSLAGGATTGGGGAGFTVTVVEATALGGSMVEESVATA